MLARPLEMLFPAGVDGKEVEGPAALLLLIDKFEAADTAAARRGGAMTDKEEGEEMLARHSKLGQEERERTESREGEEISKSKVSGLV